MLNASISGNFKTSLHPCICTFNQTITFRAILQPDRCFLLVISRFGRCVSQESLLFFRFETYMENSTHIVALTSCFEVESSQSCRIMVSATMIRWGKLCGSYDRTRGLVSLLYIQYAGSSETVDLNEVRNIYWRGRNQCSALNICSQFCRRVVSITSCFITICLSDLYVGI